MLADPAVADRRSVYEYVLVGEEATRFLGIRLFDAPTRDATGATVRRLRPPSWPPETHRYLGAHEAPLLLADR